MMDWNGGIVHCLYFRIIILSYCYLFVIAELTKQQCSQQYGVRQYFPDTSTLSHEPGLLYSFQGSGNTWVRLLLEHSTGIYTGSAYNDDKLYDVLPGEKVCNRSVLIVKVHPVNHRIGPRMAGPVTYSDNKCIKGGLSSFNKYVLLVRNPYDAFWSEYQRRKSNQSHVGGIAVEKFNWFDWQYFVFRLTYSYREMLFKDYEHLYDIYNTSALHKVRYEDLRDAKIRDKVLRDLVRFVLPPTIPLDQNRLSCAFPLAETEQVHRNSKGVRYVTKERGGLYPIQLTCRVWQSMKTKLSQWGYSPFNATEELCSSYPPMLPYRDSQCHLANIRFMRGVDMRQPLTKKQLDREEELRKCRKRMA